jgi:alginate O-acetyltransferase complex protein AlgI
MSFNSLQYFLFLPSVLLLFHFTRDRWRWAVLLLGSLGFYAALGDPYLLAALATVTMTTYALGIRIGRAGSARGKTALLWIGIAINLLVLISMRILHSMTVIGVSYYTIQAICYLVDIYLETGEAEAHPGRFALYLSVFPKILQGPIERGRDLIPQLRSPYVFDYTGARVGMLRIAGGLFKKMVIADRLAQYVNPVYDNVHAYSGVVFIVATYLYALQIYYDFSGYTDIALGSARLFGIRLTENFRNPYTATSIADFWRRWHISFSRWILDYIFRPLQIEFRHAGNRGTAAALILTFLASGLWHGFGWGFVVWGLLHGLFLACSVYYKPHQRSIYRKLGAPADWKSALWQRFITFHLVCLAWIFFRANSIADAGYILTHLFAGTGKIGRLLTSQERLEMWICVVSLGIMAFIYHLGNRRDKWEYLFSKPAAIRWCFYYATALYILMFGKYFSPQTFIYGKF